MLPALRLTTLAGETPKATSPCTQLWWLDEAVTAVTYLYDDGRIRASAVFAAGICWPIEMAA